MKNLPLAPANGISTSVRSHTAGLLRRLLAIGYDGLLLFGLLFVAAIPLTWLSEAARSAPGVRLGIQGYLLAVSAAFFTWFWVHGGQTLGMRAWRLRLVADDGGPVGWQRAAWRFLAAMLSLACLGMGFLWVLIDREGLAWHDRLSKTRVIVESKGAGGPGPGAVRRV